MKTRYPNIIRFMSRAAAIMTVGGGLATVACSTTDVVDDNVRQTSQLVLAGDALTAGHRVLGYFAQWGIYGGHGMYDACDIPFDYYTHINYAFVGVRPVPNPAFSNPSSPGAFGETGSYDADFKWLKTLDYHADEGHTNCTGFDSTSITYGGQYGGSVGLLKLAKSNRPWLKVGVSLGGWTKGAGFPVVAADSTKRQEFANDLVRLVDRWDLDYIDLDWEYPGVPRQPDPNDSNDEGNPYAGPADTQNYTELLRTLRSTLDNAGHTSVEITSAVGAAKDKLDKIQWATLNSEGLMDMVNMMTYDFHGGFDAKTGHQSALFANPNDSFNAPVNTEYNSAFAFNYLTQTLNWPAAKTSVGLAFYTRGWNNVSGGIDVDGNGTTDGLFGPGGGSLAGDWGPGGQNGMNKIYELRGTSGWEEIWDDSAKAHFLYNRSQGILYTYDSVRAVEEKGNFCLSKGCGGVFNWEIDGDAYVGGQAYPLAKRAAEMMTSTGDGTGCTPTTCAQHGATCGSVSDGCGNTLNCGTCSSGSCINNQCQTSCTPTSCSALGATCGSVGDGCGGTLGCGSCSTGQVCSATNTCVSAPPPPPGCTAPTWDPSIAYLLGTKVSMNGFEYTAEYWTQGNDPETNCCGSGEEWGTKTACGGGSCTPDCSSKNCGDDGCGGTCGTCGTGEICNGSQVCVSSCTPNCSGRTCGDDGCGGSCGTCQSGSACSAGVCSTSQTPYGGTAVAIPAIVQVENFDNGGEGVAYSDTETTNNGGQYRTSDGVDIEATSDTGGGYNVGWTQPNEWMEYTITSSGGGTFNVDFRTAGEVGGTFHMEIDGVNVTGTKAAPNTGGWQIWTTVTASSINISAGTHVVRFVTETGGFNLNYIQFSAQSSCTPGTCSSIGAACGSVSDGCGGTLNCGGCSSGYSCSGANQCVANCTPTTCSSAGAECGVISDGCGSSLSCGGCATNEVCDSNQCEAAGSGNCSEAAWSGSASYALNQIATVACVSSPVSSAEACYGRSNSTIAVKCTNATYCSTNPNGATNSYFAWSHVETCQ